MYKIFKDKDRIFKCNVDVQGADIKDCKARLVFESESGIFMLKGKIDNSGICTIKIPREKVLEEGITGNVTLEVIADNTLFEAWNSYFSVLVDKKVEVVMEDFDEKEELEKVEDTGGPKISAVLIEDEEDEVEIEIPKPVIKENKEEEKKEEFKKLDKESSKDEKPKNQKNESKPNSEDIGFMNFDSFIKNKK